MQRPQRSSVYWLVPHDLLVLLHTEARTQGWHTCSRLGPPTSMVNQSIKQKHTPDLSTGQPSGDIFSIKAPSSQMTLAYVMLT